MAGEFSEFRFWSGCWAIRGRQEAEIRIVAKISKRQRRLLDLQDLRIELTWIIKLRSRFIPIQHPDSPPCDGQRSATLPRRTRYRLNECRRRPSSKQCGSRGARQR